jgi:hypothetical protein
VLHGRSYCHRYSARTGLMLLYSTSSEICETETIFLQFPSATPLSHIICAAVGYVPVTYYRQLVEGSSSTTGRTIRVVLKLDILLTSLESLSSAIASSQPSTSSSPASSTSNKAVIAGIVVGVTVFILFLVALIGVVMYFRKRLSKLDNQDAPKRKSLYELNGDQINDSEADSSGYPLVLKAYSKPSPSLAGSPRAMSIQTIGLQDEQFTGTATVQSFINPGPVELSAVSYKHEAIELPTPILGHHSSIHELPSPISSPSLRPRTRLHEHSADGSDAV